MKINKAILAVSLFIGTTTACTDEWDEHYSVTQHGEGSLWQAISNDESLSNFKQVLQAANYDGSLGGSQVFTVFAPTNTVLTDDMRDALIQQYNTEKANGVKEKDNSVVKEFIQNHISLYNYSVSTAMPDTIIRMMNSKNLSFTKDNFAGHTFLSKNNITTNGIIYTIDNIADYHPNVYEAFNKVEGVDSVWKYISMFDKEELNTASSVPGEIIDGKTHYLDSVTYILNPLLEESKYLNSSLLDEDSCYWMVVPDNQLWDHLVTKYSRYYVYDKKVAERDSFGYHFPRQAILKGTVFSKTNNKEIFQSETASATDSLLSTNAIPYSRRKIVYGSYDKKYYMYFDPFGENGVLNGSEETKCSNGKLFKATAWNIPEKSTFLREIVMEAESSNTLDSLNINTSNNKTGDTNLGKIVKVASDNPYYDKVSGNSYIEITPAGVSNFTKALFDVRDVLSNVPYDVYVVIAPAEAGNIHATDIQKLPITFRCALQCHNEDGEPYYINIKDNKLQYPVLDNKNRPTSHYTKSSVYGTNLQNDPTKIDSILIGTVTFPTCSNNTNEPQVKLLFQSYVTSSAYEKTANRTLRLDCIVLKPHDE